MFRFLLCFFILASIVCAEPTTLSYPVTDFPGDDCNTWKFHQEIEASPSISTSLQAITSSAGTIGVVFVNAPTADEIIAIQGSDYPSPIGGLIAAHDSTEFIPFVKDDSVSSTTSSEWTTKVAFIVPPMTGEIVIQGMAEYALSGSTKEYAIETTLRIADLDSSTSYEAVAIRLVNETDQKVLGLATYSSTVKGIWQLFLAFDRIQMTGSSKRFTIQYSVVPNSTAGTTVTIRNSRIMY